MTGQGPGDDHREGDARDRAEIGRLADEVIPALAARLGASGLGELEVRGAGWRVRLRREPRVVDGGSDPGRGRATGHSPGTAGRGSPEDGSRDAGLTRSPAVGYFGPRPDLAVGLAVRAGDALGHVEVLGLRQEVSAGADGIVGHVFAEAGQAVEYGQELVRIDTVRRHDAPGSAADPGDAG